RGAAPPARLRRADEAGVRAPARADRGARVLAAAALLAPAAPPSPRPAARFPPPRQGVARNGRRSDRARVQAPGGRSAEGGRPLRRLGTRRRGPRRPRDGAARAAGVRRRLGQPAQGPPGVSAARGRDAGSFAVRRSFSPGTEPREPRGARRGARRNRKEARSVKEILEDIERWRARGEKI